MYTRRQFLRAGAGIAAASIVAPPSLAAAAAAPRRSSRLVRGGRFAQGVLSGEPTPTSITLLTLLEHVGGRAGAVRLEVAKDPHFRRVVAREHVATSRVDNWSVKARVGGLEPHEEYFYRFETRDSTSPVGRFRTALPPDSHEPVRFAFFSCADYTHGWYNAYEAMSRLDLDFVLNLGDYIYAEAYHTIRDGMGVREDRIGSEPSRADLNFAREALTLADYRDKYALYRSDASLRRMHARFPMVSTWDDHEVENNYTGGAHGGGLPADRRWSAARRRAAYRAYFESMPLFPVRGTRIYRERRYGAAVDLLMLDERQYRDDQPCGDAVVPACAEWNQPRAFLGAKQMRFAKQRLSRSGAAWKVVGNELLMMPAQVGAATYFTYDAWHGYPREREELLQHIRRERIRDVVFLTGDIHSFFAGDVRTELGAGESVALEFVGGSITSQGLGETTVDLGNGARLVGNDRQPNTPRVVIEALIALNPWVDYADFDHHGFGVVEATPKDLTVTFKRLSTIKRRMLARERDVVYRVARGTTSIKGQNPV